MFIPRPTVKGFVKENDLGFIHSALLKITSWVAKDDQEVELVGTLPTTSKARDAQEVELVGTLPTTSKARDAQEVELVGTLPTSSFARVAQEIILVAVPRFNPALSWTTEGQTEQQVAKFAFSPLQVDDTTVIWPIPTPFKPLTYDETDQYSQIRTYKVVQEDDQFLNNQVSVLDDATNQFSNQFRYKLVQEVDGEVFTKKKRRFVVSFVVS